LSDYIDNCDPESAMEMFEKSETLRLERGSSHLRQPSQIRVLSPKACQFHLMELPSVIPQSELRGYEPGNEDSQNNDSPKGLLERSEDPHGPTSNEITPAFFRTLKVFVKTDDETESRAICTAMENLGAILQVRLEDAEVIISTERIPVTGTQSRSISSGPQKRPLNYLVRQIPWFRNYLTKPRQAKQGESKTRIVVADIKGRLSPLYRDLDTGCITKLSDLLAPEAEREMNLVRRIVYSEPPEKGFCYFCNCNYEYGCLHRRGSAHMQESMGSRRWQVFDALSAKLAINFV
jgi:hypothetical protein